MNSDLLNNIFEKIKSLRNSANLPLTDNKPIEKNIRLIRDDSVAPSKFKQSRIDPYIYYASQLTISAVKKDLFMVGNDFEDLEDIKECVDCKREIDTQFWKLCPFCEGKLPS